MRGMMVACTALAAMPLIGGAEQLKPKALVVMLDGMRADAVENACAPNMQMLCAGQWQPGYHCAYSLQANTIHDAPSVSAPNHNAIATGYTATKTNVKNNGQFKNCDYAKYPSWLTRLVTAKPETKALFMFSWRPDIEICPNPKVEFVHGTDFANGAAMPKRLAAPDGPDAVMLYIDLPDHGGHGFGYYPYTTGYLNTVYQSDRIIGDCLKAIASRTTFAQEDWLIIITSDHGGYWRSHGLMGGQATAIPLLVSGRNVSQGRIPGTPHNFDTTPTVLAHFGLDVSGLGFDGKVVGKETVSDPQRPLKDGLAVYLPFSGKTLANSVSGGPVPEAKGKTAVIDRGEFIGGCLRVATDTNKVGGVCLKGSEKLEFENGGDFAITVWVRQPAKLTGDPAIVSNTDWNNGYNPGVVLVASKAMPEAKLPGVCFNSGIANGGRHDIGPYDVEFGKWTFYAVTRSRDGVLRFYQGCPQGNLYQISENTAGITIKSGMPFYLGQDGTGTYKCPFNGDIDEFALWTRTLSHQDIRRIYEAGRKGVELADLLNAPAGK